MWQTFQDTTSETDCDKTSETDFKTVSFNPQNDCGLGTLSYDFAHTINNTFKMAYTAARPNEVILVVVVTVQRVGDRT